MIDLDAIHAFLHHFLEGSRFPDDPSGVLRPAPGAISRLGLALEPDAGLDAWVRDHALDAVVLHRPWALEPGTLQGVGVLAYHLAFDHRMTLGCNARLAEILGIRILERAPERNGRVAGLMGQVRMQPFAAFQARVAEVFGGIEAMIGCDAPRPVQRVALMGAMTEDLVHWAADRAVDVYVTGQLRKPAREAVERRGLSVIAVGHARSEAWGLRALAHVIAERWRGLEVLVRDPLT